MNTFRDIARDELDRALGSGEWITSQCANMRAAARILEGFRTLEEAEEYARIGLGVCCIFGYPIAPDAIEQAIRVKLRDVK